MNWDLFRLLNRPQHPSQQHLLRFLLLLLPLTRGRLGWGRFYIAYATGTHAAKRISVPLMHRVAFNQDTGFVANLTTIPNESNAYYSYPFIRSSTLADLRDYRALTAGVGNLATISMTGSWLRSHDIYSGSVANTANGIKLITGVNDFIDTEFTRSLPDDLAEKSELCTPTAA
jgi:hypothetical protein